MSQLRQRLTLEQEPFLVARSSVAGCTNGCVIAAHRHDWHQLVYAVSGAMTVQAGRSTWMTPPGKALYVPAGCLHSIRMWGNVASRFLYFPASLQSPALAATDCRVLSVTSLLRELILRVTELAALDSRVPSHQSLLNVLLDEMHIAPLAPLMLPLPADTRALSVAMHVLDSPAGSETLDDLAHIHGAARRTLERLFSYETGLSFGLWRQKVRMLASLRILAEGSSVTEASLEAGYSSVSAFIAAFRQTFGCTPKRFELLQRDSADAGQLRQTRKFADADSAAQQVR
jgi:AraC-like DNA-binding protein